MRKLILTFLTAFTLLSVTSCDAYAQAVVYDEGFVYEYSYNNHPVRYFNGVPYYYALYNNIWTWIMLDRIYHKRIVHYPRPVRYVHQRYTPYYNEYNHKPRQRTYNPDRMSPRPQPDRRRGYGHQNQIGGRPQGNFSHSSSRGGRR